MKKTILIVLGGGGHTQQMLILAERLKEKYNIEYVIKKGGKKGGKKLEGKIFKIIDPRKMKDYNKAVVILKLIPYSIQAFKILSKSKAQAIIICGPAVSVPLAFLGKIFFRKKIIFIESWSRVKSKSLSGKLINPFSDLIFVQWKKNKEYKKAIYAGRLG